MKGRDIMKKETILPPKPSSVASSKTSWMSIQDTVDYIEEHINEELKIEQLANVAHLSVYYFQRLFNRFVGKSVNDYIKSRRVARAKNELKDSSKKIIDIALDNGFNSHETFSKAFKEVYGVTPTEYKNGDMVLNDFLKPDLSMNYTLVEENVPLIVDDMIIDIRKEEKLENDLYLGLKKAIDASEMNKIGENTLIYLWNEFHEIKKDIQEIDNDEPEIDYFEMNSNGQVYYFVGGLASAKNNAYDEIQFTKGSYYVCSFEAENFEYLVQDALYKANQYFFEVWLSNKNIQMNDMEPFLIQKYFYDKENPRIEIWIKPLK